MGVGSPSERKILDKPDDTESKKDSEQVGMTNNFFR